MIRVVVVGERDFGSEKVKLVVLDVFDLFSNKYVCM